MKDNKLRWTKELIELHLRHETYIRNRLLKNGGTILSNLIEAKEKGELNG